MKKSALVVATLLSSLSSTAVIPASYAEDSQLLPSNPGFDTGSCLGCRGATYCTPGCEGGPGFQDCAGCFGREGPDGTTEDAETAS
jgi:hypothetical protein